jgi:hypothetical protein
VPCFAKAKNTAQGAETVISYFYENELETRNNRFLPCRARHKARLYASGRKNILKK